MKIFAAAFVVVSLSVSSAFAGKPPAKTGHHHHHHNHGHHNIKIGVQFGGYQPYYGKSFGVTGYHQQFGKSFVGGFYYPGKVHNHWSYQCYWPKYNCMTYWCPSSNSYYYWCGSAGCYYPISYIAKAAPTVTYFNGPYVAPPAGIPLLPK